MVGRKRPKTSADNDERETIVGTTIAVSIHGIDTPAL